MKLFSRQVGQYGQPIVILHGIFGSCDNWLTIGKVLGQNYRVFMLDARNQGHSPHADSFDYEVMAADVLEFVEDNQLDQPILIGHSMGGKVMMQFALNYPTAFSKMIVVDIAPKFYPVHHSMILQGLNSLNLNTLKTRQEANEHLARFEENEGTRQFLLKNLYRDTSTGFYAWRINLPVITNSINIVGDELSNQHVVDQDVLFMKGSESNYILSEDERPILELFPNAQFVTINGAGHWVQADQSEAFIEAINNFV
jgi:pimeloyl-ACP methyl ester carboxylesterase